MTFPIAELKSLPLTRRVVTGQDEDAKAKVIYDDSDGDIRTLPTGSNRFQTVWLSNEFPVDCSSATNNDPTQKELSFPFGDEGSRCIVTWSRPGSSSPMHRTASIDYAVVVAGEIELEMENGDRRLLKTGDVVVQRGTKHAWHNRHPTEWAKMFCVLIRAQE